LLSIENVSVDYGGVRAVSGLNLRVGQGEVVALIGSNGAGKTTTLRTISGLIRPATGTIKFEDRPVERERPASIVGLGISHVPEGRRIFPRLTVQDNLELGAYRESSAVMRQRATEVYELFPVLRSRSEQLAATLSGGEQQMLAVGRAVMAGPRLVLLDEPSLGLAPIVVRALFSALKRIRDTGVTILLVEQNARLALSFSDRAYVLERGRVVCSGSSSDVSRDERVVPAYLSYSKGKRDGSTASH
jgi:branched-chain amino acid transport system ATP-binding protein